MTKKKEVDEKFLKRRAGESMEAYRARLKKVGIRVSRQGNIVPTLSSAERKRCAHGMGARGGAKTVKTKQLAASREKAAEKRK